MLWINWGRYSLIVRLNGRMIRNLSCGLLQGWIGGDGSLVGLVDIVPIGLGVLGRGRLAWLHWLAVVGDGVGGIWINALESSGCGC